VRGQKLILIIAAGVVGIFLIAIIAALTVGPPPTVEPDPTPTPRAVR
jgi:hypothetical protein